MARIATSALPELRTSLINPRLAFNSPLRAIRFGSRETATGTGTVSGAVTRALLVECRTTYLPHVRFCTRRAFLLDINAIVAPRISRGEMSGESEVLSRFLHRRRAQAMSRILAAAALVALLLAAHAGAITSIAIVDESSPNFLLDTTIRVREFRTEAGTRTAGNVSGNTGSFGAGDLLGTCDCVLRISTEGPDNIAALQNFNTGEGALRLRSDLTSANFLHTTRPDIDGRPANDCGHPVAVRATFNATDPPVVEAELGSLTLADVALPPEGARPARRETPPD